MEFFEKIKMLRKEMHMSQPAVAAEIGISFRGYQDMELGTFPRYEKLQIRWVINK